MQAAAPHRTSRFRRSQYTHHAAHPYSHSTLLNSCRICLRIVLSRKTRSHRTIGRPRRTETTRLRPNDRLYASPFIFIPSRPCHLCVTRHPHAEFFRLYPFNHAYRSDSRYVFIPLCYHAAMPFISFIVSTTFYVYKGLLPFPFRTVFLLCSPDGPSFACGASLPLSLRVL